MNSLFNINVCRVCMQNNQSCDLWKDKDLLEKFIFTTRLQVAKEDNLPKHICSKCTTRLKVAFTFIKMAHASDNNLKKFLEKINSEFKEVTLGNKGNKKFPNEQNFSEDDLLSLMNEDITSVEINNNDDIQKSKDVEIDKCKDETSYNFSDDFLLVHTTTENDSEYENSSHFMEIPIQGEEESEHYNEVEEDSKLENNEKYQGVSFLDSNEESYIRCQSSELRTDETDANYEREIIFNSQDDTIQYQSVYVDESSGEEANLKDCGNNNVDNFDEIDEMHENVQKKYNVNEFKEAEANTLCKKEIFLHRFYCKKCNRDFSTKTNLNRHMQSHEGNKPFSCTECKKSFTQKSTLKQHMYTHTGERPYVCEVCSRGFTQCKSLIFHMRRHTGEKPFHCEYCLITFRQKDALRIHILKHHVVIERTMYGTELFSCIICQKKFETKLEFKTHMKVHTAASEVENTIEILQNEEKMLSMKLKKNIDAATSSDSECLKAAVVNVSASSASEPSRAKKFQCRKCFKCFAIKKSLVRHMRIHYIKNDGDLTECFDCDLQFSSAEIYQEHLSLCHQYACSACPDLVFKTIQQLKVHIFEHGLDQQEQNIT